MRSRDQRRVPRMLGELRCRLPEGNARGGSPPAARMRFRMGQAAPFRKGGFSQALFFPKQNAGGVSRSADRDEGAALDPRTFEKVRSKL